MSVRAYKIYNIELANEATFNLWHHQKVVDLLNIDAEQQIITIEKDQVRKALKETKEPETRDILYNILKDIGEDTAVDYQCF